MGLTGSGNVGDKLQGSGKGNVLPNSFRVSNYQTYTLTFEPNSAKYNALTIEQGGTIQQIDAPSGTILYKAISTSPFQQQVGTGDSVSEGDIVTVELDSVPTSKETVEIVVNYSDVSISKILSEDLGGDGRYGYLFSPSNQEVYVFDSDDNSVTIISLPSGYNFVDAGFRGHASELFFFAEGYYLVIDTNFNTIVRQQSINFEVVYNASGYSVNSPVYNYNQDVFYMNVNPDNAANGYFTPVEFNPENENVRNLGYELFFEEPCSYLNYDGAYMYSFNSYNPERLDVRNALRYSVFNNSDRSNQLQDALYDHESGLYFMARYKFTHVYKFYKNRLEEISNSYHGGWVTTGGCNMELYSRYIYFFLSTRFQLAEYDIANMTVNSEGFGSKISTGDNNTYTGNSFLSEYADRLYAIEKTNPLTVHEFNLNNSIGSMWVAKHQLTGVPDDAYFIAKNRQDINKGRL
jgi:hypothetical protein